MTFDLEKAREAVRILETFAFASGKITTGQVQDILWGARLLAGASTEIERQRAELARVNQLRGTEIDQAGAAERIYVEAARLKDARIQELEDDLETAKASIRFDREEIERMRPYEKVAADLQACGSYVGIGPGEGDLPITERVRRCVNRLKETQHEYEQKLITKDARIQELEDDLETAKASLRFDKEEIERLRARDKRMAEAIVSISDRTKRYVLSTHAITKSVLDEADSLVDYCEKLAQMIIAKDARIQELEDALVEAKAAIKFCLDEGDEDENYGPMHDLPEWRELPEKDKDTFRDWCRKQLQAEGKIGPDATPKIKRCYSCGRSLDEIDCDNFTCCDCAPSWQITDERRRAIAILVVASNPEKIGNFDFEEEEAARAVLQAMLREAEQ